MSAPRHDIYNPVHKAIRANLFATATRLATCDFADVAERREALGAALTSLTFLDEHAALEDEFMLPKVAEANTEVGTSLTDVHHGLDATGAAVRDLIQTLAGAEADVAMALSRELCLAFYLLVAEHVEHMHVEETEANNALWSAFDDDTLRALQGRMLASIPPEKFTAWLRIILPAINVHERIGMMRGMKASAPTPAFERVMALGRELVGAPWEAVEAAL